MKIAVFTGPTGGHFYPALAFCEAFKERHPLAEILFVTSERGRDLVDRARARFAGPYEFLPDFPFPSLRSLDFIIRIGPFLLKLGRAFSVSLKILNQFQPDLAVGFGSYAASPALWLASRRKIPTLIHEQNRKMGKANAWLRPFVDRIALSFGKDEGMDKKGRAILTGFPLRRALLDAASRNLGLKPPGLCRILVLGGSQGSRALNDLWCETFQGFSREEKSKLAVIHITGEKDHERMRAMYLNEAVEAKIYSFYERMEELYSASDIALTRAGAGTLFELALFGLPAIVIPYPHAASHQEENARYFEKNGALMILNQREATPAQLRKSLLPLMNSQECRKKISDNLKKMARPQAAESLVGTAEELLP